MKIPWVYIIGAIALIILGWLASSSYSSYRNKKLEAELTRKREELIKVQGEVEAKRASYEAERVEIKSTLDAKDIEISNLQLNLKIASDNALVAQQRAAQARNAYEQIKNRPIVLPPPDADGLIPTGELRARAERILTGSSN